MDYFGSKVDTNVPASKVNVTIFLFLMERDQQLIIVFQDEKKRFFLFKLG